MDLYRRRAARWLLVPVGHGRESVDLAALPLRLISPARAWATAAGLPVAATGRLSPAIRATWAAAGSPLPASTRQAHPGAGRTTTAQAYRLLHAILATAVGDRLIAAGRRVVALPAFVVDELRVHLARHVTPGADALLFTTATGAAVAAGTRAKAITRARAAISRPDVTWHHLRHTGATLAAQAGATQAELMRRIGHSSPRAAALYQHASLARDTQLAATLNLLATATTA